MSLTREEACVVPISQLLLSLKSNFIKIKHLPLLWILRVLTLQMMMFMLKQQHYTLI